MLKAHLQQPHIVQLFALAKYVLLMAVWVATPPAHADPQSTITSETITLPNLRQPVEILIDHWGVPHIYAKNEADLFFAQGFNAARDRLFQIDLWRRRGLGQLSEVFGPAFVEQDKATRLFLYRGYMDKEWAVYGPDAKQIAEHFVAGVNAYIDWLAYHADCFPWEFKELKYAPAKWSADDVVRIRSHGLTRNLNSEVARSRVICAADLKSDEVRLGLQPPWQPQVPPGFDPCLPKELLRVFTLATQAVFLTPAALKVAATGEFASPVESAGDEQPTENFEGSNNWVIAPWKSATGRAVMANDPHRAYSEPSLRYISDLNAPTLHVIGANEPALPGVSFGHNDWIAFGYTIFPIDQEDLYIYELNPENSGQYKYQGSWEPFRVVREEIKVKGQAPMPVDLTFTRHGPVIYIEKGKNRAFAVRSAWLEPGMAPYYGLVRTMRAKNFDAALRLPGAVPGAAVDHDITPTFITGILVRLTVWAAAGWWLAYSHGRVEFANTLVLIVKRTWSLAAVVTAALILGSLLASRLIQCLHGLPKPGLEGLPSRNGSSVPRWNPAGLAGAGAYVLVVLVVLLIAAGLMICPYCMRRSIADTIGAAGSAISCCVTTFDRIGSTVSPPARNFSPRRRLRASVTATGAACRSANTFTPHSSPPAISSKPGARGSSATGTRKSAPTESRSCFCTRRTSPAR